MRVGLHEISAVSQYDYIIVGSGFTALAFVEETIRLNPRSRILCIERGNDDFASHYERLWRQTREEVGAEVRYPDVAPNECPWSLSRAMGHSVEVSQCAGMSFLLGGRSHYWYGWCMQPDHERMPGYPLTLAKAIARPEFWRRASASLGVRSVDKLRSIASHTLQNLIESRLKGSELRNPSIIDNVPALFATGDMKSGTFSRYCTSDRLLELRDSCRVAGAGCLDILLDHTVEQLECRNVRGKSVNTILTDKGCLTLQNSGPKIILCGGAIPNAIILLNSFPRLEHTIGQSITGHFRSHIFAKVPLASISRNTKFNKGNGHGLAARVIRGCDPSSGQEYHIQLSAFYGVCDGGDESQYSSGLPRYGTAPVWKHTQLLKDEVLLCCTALGEMSANSRQSWLRLNKEKHASSNVDLHMALCEADQRLWNMMDTTTFEIIQSFGDRTGDVTYWIEEKQNWAYRRPSRSEYRSPVIVHEASTTPTGFDAATSTVDEQFKVRGVENVYVTGAGVLPTAGSWNPTLTICGSAQELARILAS